MALAGWMPSVWFSFRCGMAVADDDVTALPWRCARDCFRRRATSVYWGWGGWACFRVRARSAIETAYHMMNKEPRPTRRTPQWLRRS